MIEYIETYWDKYWERKYYALRKIWALKVNYVLGKISKRKSLNLFKTQGYYGGP